MRKLRMRDGAVIDELLSELEALDAPLAEAGDELAIMRSTLAEALAWSRSATAWLIERASVSPDDALAGATVYLDLLGSTLGGALLARSALRSGTPLVRHLATSTPPNGWPACPACSARSPPAPPASPLLTAGRPRIRRRGGRTCSSATSTRTWRSGSRRSAGRRTWRPPAIGTPGAGPTRIPAARYTSPAFADLEHERLWPHVWQIACTVDHVAHPGDVYELRCGWLSVLIVRGDDGELRAFQNACRHRGNSLCEGMSSG